MTEHKHEWEMKSDGWGRIWAMCNDPACNVKLSLGEVNRRLNATEMLRAEALLYRQRVQFELAKSYAIEHPSEYELVAYMLRDLPLTKDAELLVLTCALATPTSGYTSKGDWDGLCKFWDEAWRNALANILDTS